jgi:hypothetical protein
VTSTTAGAKTLSATYAATASTAAPAAPPRTR